MKTLLLLLSLVAFAATSCQKEIETEVWWINSAKVDCTGVGPMSCFQIQKGSQIDPAQWELFYDEIEGFAYEPGSIYQIKVQVDPKQEPIPADAGAFSYKLVEILSQEPDKSLALTNIWKVLEVGEIKDPKSFKTGEALIFEFNKTAGTYFGDMGCNSVRGAIKEADAEKLVLGPGASTMMACPDMAPELAIGQALITTRKYKIDSNQLHLMDSLGTVLMKFQAVD